MTTRQTVIPFALLAVCLLLANALYFSHGVHRPLTWLLVCVDVIFVAVAIVGIAAHNRK